MTNSFDTSALLGLYSVGESLHQGAVWQECLQDSSIDGSSADWLKALASGGSLLITITTANGVLSVANLFDSDLLAISTGVHLGAISVLNKKTAVFVGDCADIILTNHHLSVSDGISFGGTGDGFQIAEAVTLVRSALSLVVRHDPLHGRLAEAGNDAVWVEDLGVTVVHLPDHDTFAGDQAIGLGVSILAFRAKLSVVHLANFTRAE